MPSCRVPYESSSPIVHPLSHFISDSPQLQPAAAAACCCAADRRGFLHLSRQTKGLGQTTSARIVRIASPRILPPLVLCKDGRGSTAAAAAAAATADHVVKSASNNLGR